MAPPVPEIKNLKELLETSIKGIKFLDSESSYLTKPGDNYGSIMLRLRAKIRKSGETKESTLELVAKLPLVNSFMRDIFQPEITFIKENNFYKSIYPAIESFQRARGIPKEHLFDVFAHCYAVRDSLDEAVTAYDDDAVLILENLKTQGYIVGDRMQGFSKKEALFILEKLAMMHALPIAVRYGDPALFKSKILPYLDKVDLEAKMPEMMQEMRQSVDDSLDKVITNEVLNKKVKKLFNDANGKFSQATTEFDDPFNTLSHGDFWTNNMLIALDSQGTPIKLKIVDFQVASYDSLVKDIIFFLTTSVVMDIVEKDFEELLKHYFKHFQTNLAVSKIPLDDFTYEKFKKEVKSQAKHETYHILAMLRPLYMRDVPEMDQMNNDTFQGDDRLDPKYYVVMERVIKFMENNGFL